MDTDSSSQFHWRTVACVSFGRSRIGHHTPHRLSFQSFEGDDLLIFFAFHSYPHLVKKIVLPLQTEIPHHHFVAHIMPVAANGVEEPSQALETQGASGSWQVFPCQSVRAAPCFSNTC